MKVGELADSSNAALRIDAVRHCDKIRKVAFCSLNKHQIAYPSTCTFPNLYHPCLNLQHMQKYPLIVLSLLFPMYFLNDPCTTFEPESLLFLMVV